MAKSKSFFGLRTGSTKSLTFQTLRGQQITKDRVTSVSNPQTIAQMDQRLLLPMVANARTRLAGLVDHSFEGVPYGYQSLQKFSSLNLQKGALTVSSYVPKGLSDPGRANFIISDGSLHTPLDEPALVNGDSRLFFGSGVTGQPAAEETKIFPAMPEGTKGSTVMYYLNRFMASNDALSWFSPNSQLTFLGQGTKTTAKYTASDGSEKQYPLSAFAIMRLVNPAAYPAETKAGTALTVDELKDYHDDNDKFVLGHEVVAEGSNAVILRSVVADIYIEVGFFQTTEGSGKAEYEFGFTPYFNAVHAGSFALACACIFSQLDGSVWRRSRTRLTVMDSSKAATREDVIGGYLKSGSESTKYLNTGTEGTGIVGAKKG